MAAKAPSKIMARSKKKERKCIGIDAKETSYTKGKEWSDDARLIVR
jgi:hypothetical protein